MSSKVLISPGMYGVLLFQGRAAVPVSQSDGQLNHRSSPRNERKDDFDHHAVSENLQENLPFSPAPEKWDSINLFFEQWKSLYDRQGDHHDQPVHHRTYNQVTMSYPLPMDQRVIPGPLENRGGIRESTDTGQFCQFKDGRNGPLESITIPHDSTKLDKTTSAMAELRDSAVSPVISLMNSNASVAMMKPQKTITPSVVRVQSNFCLAVEDISESAKRYAASLTGSRIRDRIVLWRLSTPRVLRSIQAILPKTTDNQPQDRCAEDTLAQNPILQNAAVQELID